MVSVSPAEARDLIEAGIDVVDVREPSEFVVGHVPRARNVPLAAFRKNPRHHVRGARVLFVCARGMRSETAGRIANEVGIPEIHHLAGGTQAWEELGFAVEREPEPAEQPPSDPSPVDAPPADAANQSCGLPEPGLDVVVGANMRRLRLQQNLTLDQLARATGLSRTLLGQIELGQTSPGINAVWRIAQAFDVQFSALLAAAESAETTVLRRYDAKRLVGPDGRFSSRALYPLAEQHGVEFYELFLAAHSREDAQAHRPGTRENLVVTAGRLEIHVRGQRYDLDRGDAIVFLADVPHSYVNPGSEDCVMYLVMTYAA